jgi:hypothetical protein
MTKVELDTEERVVTRILRALRPLTRERKQLVLRELSVLYGEPPLHAWSDHARVSPQDSSQ